MARLNRPCPLCGPEVAAREDWEDMTPIQRKSWTKSICDRCWDAVTDALVGDEKPVNEAEQSVEAWA